MTEQQTRQWAMILHLSQLANCIIPLSGVVAPIVIWQVKKAEMPELDEHGKIVVNWLISALIYGIVSAVLTAVLIGILGFIALGVCAVVFPIVGGIKANSGEVWKYPLTITFIK